MYSWVECINRKVRLNHPISSKIIDKTYPTVTSNMFEPTDDDTAISPFPCFATKTLVIKSGTDVPAAKKVNPMTYIDNDLIKCRYK